MTNQSPDLGELTSPADLGSKATVMVVARVWRAKKQLGNKYKSK